MPLNCPTTGLTLGTLAVQVSAAKETAIRHLATQFGDGYSERRKDGINTRRERWRLSTPPAAIEQVLLLEEELAALGTGRFQWCPPGEAAAQWWHLAPVSWARNYATEDLIGVAFSIERAF